MNLFVGIKMKIQDGNILTENYKGNQGKIWPGKEPGYLPG